MRTWCEIKITTSTCKFEHFHQPSTGKHIGIIGRSDVFVTSGVKGLRKIWDNVGLILPTSIFLN